MAAGILKSGKFFTSLYWNHIVHPLKKVTSISLVAILLLNVMGYYGVFVGLQYQNDMVMTRQLDSDQYDESRVVTLKIPITVAYVGDDHDFKRVTGKFEYDGEYYRLIKQKYAHDTLTIVCFRDIRDKRIQQGLSKYVKTFSDTPGEQNQNYKLSVSFIKDYIAANFSIQTITAGWEKALVSNTANGNLTPTFIPSITHPPERA